MSLVRRAGRPGAAVDVATNDHVTVSKGATTPMAPLLRSREVRTNPVGIVCPEMNLVGNATSVR